MRLQPRGHDRRKVAGKEPDELPTDSDLHRVPVVRIRRDGNELCHRRNLVALLGSPSAKPFEYRLVMRFANDVYIVSSFDECKR